MPDPDATNPETGIPFRQIVERSPDLIFVNRVGRISYINPAGLRFLGAKTREEVVGRSPFDFIPPEWHEAVRDRIAASLRAEEELSAYTQQFVRLDGKMISMEVRAAALQRGEDWAIQVCCRDLSYRLEADRTQAALLERLRRSEKLLNMAGKLSRHGAWELRLPGPEVLWSEEISTIYELPPGVYPDLETSISYYHPECREEVELAVRACLEDGIPFDRIWRLVTAKGRERWVRAVGEPTRDEQGQVVAVRGAFQDITRQEESEREARRLSRRLERTLESITDAFFTLDREWRFTFLNSEAERLVQRSRQELLGTSIWEEFPEAVGSLFEREYRRAVETPCTVDFETYFPPLETWFEVHAYPSEEGLAVYFRDITAQRATRERLQLLETCVARMNDILLVTEAEPIAEPGPRIVFVNPAFERLTGYQAAEVIGRSPRFLQGPETDPAELKKLHDAMVAQRPERVEIVNYDKQGRTYSLEIDLAPVFGESGRATHFVALERDVTERRKMQDQLVRSQRMEAIGNLAGGIAHDLNNILAPITMSVGLLKAREESGPRRNMLNTIEACAQRGASVVRQVLSFARGIEGERALIQPQDALREVAKIVRETFPRSLRLQVEMGPANPGTLRGDPTQLHQALLNLCVNARDAMPEGGALRLALERVEIDEMVARPYDWVSPGPFLCFTVEDSGSGVPSKVRDKVFDPFFTTKAQGEGTGLGLSLVATIAKSHGGFVKLYSEEGKGSAFSLYFPAEGADEPAAEAPEEVPIPAGRGQLVLLVDDEESIREVTRQALEAHGYRVATARNGVEALSRYAQLQDEVRLVVTDMMMPEMDGVRLIETLRHMAPALPVIAVSGLHAGGSQAAPAAAAPATLTKPYTAESLLRAMGQALHDEKDD